MLGLRAGICEIFMALNYELTLRLSKKQMYDFSVAAFAARFLIGNVL